MRLSRKSPGFGLASIILVSLILGVLLTSLLGANSSTLAVVRHSEGAMTARMAAESLLARGLLEVRHKETYGSTGETLRFEPDGDESGKAILTFDSAEAKRLGIPLSVNNLADAESQPGIDGEVIPARTARLYAVGQFANEKRTVVMDLHVPAYPYAVATDGTFASLGDLTLSGISPETGDEVPGHLVANSPSSTSMILGPRTVVSGDLISAGGITLDGDNIVVKGQVKPFEAPTAIPKIPIESFDPRDPSSIGDYTSMNTSFYKDPIFEGKAVRVGDLQLTGSIDFDGALLYVKGNLQISGTLSGRGAIVCTGDVAISGTQTLSGDNEMALLAGGALTMQGRGVDSSRLEGLIYSEGNVIVRDSTIQGTLISHSNGSTIPTVVMERAEFVEDPSSADFSVGEPTEIKPTYYLAFDKNGQFKDNESGTTPLSRKKKPKDMIQIGVAEKSDGTFLVFPASGSAPVGAANLSEVLAVLKGQLLSAYGPKAGKQFEKKKPDKKLMNALNALVPAKGVVAAPPAADGPLQLSIDPMRFVKYGDTIKVRAIRVVDSQAMNRG